jgi:hypothetical protein
MGLLVCTIIEGPDYGWTSARSLLGFAVPAVLLAVFIWWEQRTSHPMLDVRLFRNMRFSAASGAVTVAFFTLFGFIFLITTESIMGAVSRRQAGVGPRSTTRPGCSAAPWAWP